MSKVANAASFCTLFLVLPLVTGCSDSDEELVPVRGTITLNGKPLANARVEFDLQGASVSEAETDGNGHYRLMFAPGQPGAPPGRHIVRIYTRRSYTDAQGKEHEEPEIRPPECNFKSKIVRTVSADKDVIDIDLVVESLKKDES
jgi:hypothetical protein